MEKTLQKNRKNSWLESLFILVLGLYPMRHIYLGLDLWDTGYNYANFRYMGLEHMDPMWLFSTYLSNVVGNFITKLPSAGSLAGMNLYTGLFVSLLALTGYFFCTGKLKIPPLISFLGEFVAISLCWCPTALLYNYLTYVLFLGSFILLYMGIIKEQKWCLFGAGICLGINVLVRFSNLPEAAMIVAVWAYGVIEALEYRKAKKAGVLREGIKSEAFCRTVKRTLWCLGGYLVALFLLFGHIAIKYGLDDYVEGIAQLFAMTDNATDYKPTSMIWGIVNTYAENMYWVIRIVVIVLVGMCICMLAQFLTQYCKPIASSAILSKIVDVGSKAICVLLAAAMLGWLYYRKFCSWEFYSYDSMLRPGILFLILTMLIALGRVLHCNTTREEKLLSGMVVLVVLLTSVGSNNGVYPSLNNLFVAAPYTLWQCALFAGQMKEQRISLGKVKSKVVLVMNPFAAKCILLAFLSMFLFQITMFGAKFVFAEATGIQDASATVENNVILKGIQMSPERAEWMTSISAYIEERDLQGREVILYGNIPSLSYYLQMPPAFNSWSDLRSYSIIRMEEDMTELEGQIEAKSAERPVIIVEKSYEDKMNSQDTKWRLIVEFMERNGYQKTFVNEKFVLWE